MKSVLLKKFSLRLIWYKALMSPMSCVDWSGCEWDPFKSSVVSSHQQIFWNQTKKVYLDTDPNAMGRVWLNVGETHLNHLLLKFSSELSVFLPTWDNRWTQVYKGCLFSNITEWTKWIPQKIKTAVWWWKGMLFYSCQKALYTCCGGQRLPLETKTIKRNKLGNHAYLTP